MTDLRPSPVREAADALRSYSIRPLVPVLAGLLAIVAGGVWTVSGATGGPVLVAALFLGLLGLAAFTLLLRRRPWLVPWGAVIIFATSAELRLRISPVFGVAKDLYVGLLLVLLIIQVVRNPAVLARLRPLRVPAILLGLLAALYVLDPASGHGNQWLFGTRLLFEVLVLLFVGVLWPHPRRTTVHLVRAMTVVLPLEAIFAWIQHSVGVDRLTHQWGYLYGAQVRSTSGGGIRTSGTFEDPFQLAALAVLGLVLAFFVASKSQTVILVLSALAALGATSVRTAFIQAGLILVVLAVRHGWWRQAAAVGAVAVVAGVFVLATTTSAVRPGAPERPLLLTLNGRSTAWAQAIQGWESFVMGNGVGVLGSGSTRDASAISAPPAYNPSAAPTAQFAGSSAFLDSSYAQVQSDVGIVGSLSFVMGNGVGVLGSGSTRDASAISAPPAYNPSAAPTPQFAGSSAFLDSSYAQVQSDVGIVGSLAFVGAVIGLLTVLIKRCRRWPRDRSAWAAVAVLVVSVVDWVGRASLASYTTGFLTLYILGVLIAATGRQEATT